LATVADRRVVCPAVTVAAAGDTVTATGGLGIRTIARADAVNASALVVPASTAWIVAVPFERAVNMPSPELDATAAFDDVHVNVTPLIAVPVSSNTVA
jgi:hypothetical protein